MKVLIVNTSERTGGAAVAAGRLTEALIGHDIKATMMVMNRQSRAPYVVQEGSKPRRLWNLAYERLVIWLHNRLSTANLFKVSIANTGLDITRTPEFQEADIIHLHWVNQGMLSLKGIAKILCSGKPVVWTMHDMWECTAICHHAYECSYFETHCHDCPFLRHPGSHDLSWRVFRRKQQLLEKATDSLTFVAVSQWLASRSRQSGLIGNKTIMVIPNALSLSHFKLTNRLDARTALGITEPYVIAFGAARIDDPIKGTDYLIEALKLLTEKHQLSPTSVRLLLFGDIRDTSLLERIPITHSHLGYVDDEDRLSLIYSAANTTVSSSLYETFGQTLIEAMACGSIPVSFDGCGQADIIQHQKTGYLAKRLSAESLADGIWWALNSQLSPQEQRRSVARRYTESIVAQQYSELYNSILNTP